MHMTKEEAARRFPILEAGRKNVDDKTASNAPEMFSRLKEVDPNSGEEIPLVKAGTRINWYGTLKKASVDLWDTKENNPDNARTLWEDLNYRAGHRIIPDVITVGLAFSNGETGWWGDVLMRSKADNNVWTPEQYPDYWEVVE